MKDVQRTGLRVVLDTNVYISALVFSESALFDIWKLAYEGRYTVIISPTIMSEFMEKLHDTFGYSDEKREKLKRDVARVARIIQPNTLPDAIPDDPDDNNILACALAGHADLIVSGDRHLLSLKEYEGIPIVRPMDFLRTLGPE